MMVMRLGDLLVQRGVLTEAERDAVLEQQRVTSRPFGLLAEEMHGLDPREVERAWATQYASLAEHVGVDDLQPKRDALAALDTRQAWQFGVLPLRFEDGELVAVTSEARLARALRFAGWRISFPCRFVIASEDDLIAGLEEHMPMAGLNAEALQTLRLTVEG